MDAPEKDKPSETTVQSEEHPSLPADFFSRLMEQPLCKRTGECDNCGQCQH